MSNLRAFHNDKAIKDKYLARVDFHIKHDNLIRGRGWEQGKGCAVGCTLEAYEHARYETELGIPEWLARLEDTLFEGMTLEKSKTWPKKFLAAIKVGAGLEPVKTEFICVILEQALKSVDNAEYDADKFLSVKAALKGSKAAVKRMIMAQRSGDPIRIAEAESA